MKAEQAIGESLSVGTPVAVADVTPWTQWIRKYSAGEVVVGDDWAGLTERLAELDRDAWTGFRISARTAYEAWWHSAQGKPHLFTLASADRSETMT